MALFAAGPALALDCPPLAGGDARELRALLARGRVVLLGEVHGTAEAPAAVAALACRALTTGVPVTIALELPETERARIERFLDSQGGAAARAALVAGDLWRQSQQDGRTSVAMADLLESLRRHRNAGELRAALFDRPSAQGSRDLAMAERLATLSDESRDRLTLVLTGNLHARIAAGAPWDPEFVPMGLHLRRLRSELDLIALDLTHEGGTAWICQGGASGCGPVGLRGTEDAEPGLELLPATAAGLFHGRFHLGPITASPPASGAGTAAR
ncbi:MAG TPA: hypothetical protein VMV46_00280 [Thermoanaerobaculia bacterium]|nr:hypothetical protein [Thermoanaerobaculia bacterium]